MYCKTFLRNPTKPECIPVLENKKTGMKKFTLLLTMIALALTPFSCKKEPLVLGRPCSDPLEGWEISSVEYPDVQRQNDLFFPTNETGFSVGNAGTIMKTSNGGLDWEVLEQYYAAAEGTNQNALTKARLLTTYFVDELVGYAGGEGEKSYFDNTNTNAVFLKTIDGGNTWNKQYLDNIIEIKDLFFFDQENGLAYCSGLNSDNNRILQWFATVDGGENWEEMVLPVSKIKSYQFISSPAHLRILASDHADNPVLLTTNDNGINWQTQNVPDSDCNRIYFIADQAGFSTFGLLFSSETAYKTTNGGDSWEAVDFPMNESSLIHFKTPDEGFVINSIYEPVEGGGEIHDFLKSFEVFQTFDGGNNWVKTELDKACNLVGINYSPSGNLFFTLGDTANRFEMQ